MSQKPLLVDSHTHIYYSDFETDFEEMLARAADSGVCAMLVVGTDLESSRRAVELAERYPQLYAAVGVHPHDAAGCSEADILAIRQLALASPKVVAIGEIGLDYYRDRSPRDVQQQLFSRFLQLAAELDKPVIIHDRDSHHDVMTLLRNSAVRRGVLHCFSGDADMATEVVAMGMYISIPGTVTYPSNEALRQVVRATPLESILVETDCPYLSPVPHRGKRNEPAFVEQAARKIAEIKGMTLEDVARITTKNAGDLFGISLWDQSAKIAYRIRNSLYLNITNHCSNRCTFCPKFDDFVVKGHNLLLQHEPSAEELLAAIGTPEGIEEIVFCGYGEPLTRLDLVKQVAGILKQRGYRIRVNTDGQANLVHGRNVLPELLGLVDDFSVSLNAPDADSYIKLCNTPFGAAGFAAVCDFIKEAAQLFPHTIASAVTIPGIDMQACQRLAESLGAQFRARNYEDVG